MTGTQPPQAHPTTPPAPPGTSKPQLGFTQDRRAAPLSTPNATPSTEPTTLPSWSSALPGNQTPSTPNPTPSTEPPHSPLTTNNSQLTLDSFTQTITAGSTIALVGRSGAGKTTLINLLPRFLTPDSGTITLDDINIADISLASLRRQIDIVTQEPLLFDDTIAANIAYPHPYDPARGQNALKNAAAADFINALPQGVETHIGENGSNLSGGQRQRLVLARAFYRDAPIIILDEATSALDGDTENKIKTAMQRLLAGRTAIIIAHRFTTIDFVDKIIVLDKGKLIAAGSADQLRQTCPLFNELYAASQQPTE